MASLVNKIRRMSYSGDNQHDETYTHAGFAVTAKNMSIINKGSKVKSSKKEIEWHVGLCVSVSKNVVFAVSTMKYLLHVNLTYINFLSWTLILYFFYKTCVSE